MRPLPVRLLAAACGLVFLAGVVAAATDDGDTVEASPAATGTDDSGPSAPSTTSTEKVEPTPADDNTSDDVVTDDARDTTATSAPPATTAPDTTSPHATASAASAVGTTPGSYIYDVSGTANGEDVSGTSTLEVGPVGADRRQAHVQTAPDGKTTTIYRHANEGSYLESLEIESDQGSFTLTATSPYLLVPADAGAGTTTRGTMKGDDLTAAVAFTLVSVDGDTSKATLHVDLSGKVQGFEVEGTMDSTIVARTADRLPLEVDATSDITVGGGVFRIRSDTRAVLRP